MGARERLRAELGAAVTGPGGALSAADRLCRACVKLLAVDGAAVSLTHDGTTMGTFGSSGEMSRRLDELQFTYGEGPCLDAVASGRPVLVGDIRDRQEQRWPAFSRAVLDSGVRAVFALPVAIAHSPVGALDLFSAPAGSAVRRRPGRGTVGGAARGAAAAGPDDRRRGLGRRR